MRRPLLLICLIALAALAVASVPLFILSVDDRVAKADAVLVLAGQKKRLPVALELVERGVAPVLVISDGLDPRWKQANRLCRSGGPNVLCPRPDPYSTRGEAQMAARLAEEHGWDSLAVVTSRFHLFRARRLFERCLDADLAFVASPQPGWRLPVAVVLEWVKLARAELQREC